MAKEKLYEVIGMEEVPVSIKIMAKSEEEALEKAERGDWGDDVVREFNHSEMVDFFVKGLCEGYEEDDWEDEDEE